MGYMEEYKKWMDYEALEPEFRAELTGISKKEIKERFFAPLQFGTAGLRGITGAGLNRMNIHTVRRATEGFGRFLLKRGGSVGAARGVVIGYDCRNDSELFAKETACVLGALGIRCHIFEAMRPTPELSFAVLRLKAIAGINITASHNPKEYNGYKAYWEDGAQLSTEQAAEVAEEIEKAELFPSIPRPDYDELTLKGLIAEIPLSMDEDFLKEVLGVTVNPSEIADAEGLGVVYTPFHGAGYELLPEAFRRLGLKTLACEPQQMVPDGNFSTVKSPNPENPDGFSLAIELAEKENAALIIGTDPDADRVGIIVRDAEGNYRPMTGNETGILLFDYIVNARRRMGTMPEKPMAVTTIVSTDMLGIMGKKTGVEVFSTFTGFKNIAGVITQKQKQGFESIFSFEESYGYMIGDFVRDKDAFGASCLILEMAAHYFNRKMNLFEALEDVFTRYKIHAVSRSVNVAMEGVAGLAKMQDIMKNLRENPPTELAGMPVISLTDYFKGTLTSGGKTRSIGISGSNVLRFDVKGARLIIRPSGTEPKIKVYILSSQRDGEKALQTAEQLEAFSLSFFN